MCGKWFFDIPGIAPPSMMPGICSSRPVDSNALVTDINGYLQRDGANPKDAVLPRVKELPHHSLFGMTL
jgi:hypothetical protein